MFKAKEKVRPYPKYILPSSSVYVIPEQPYLKTDEDGKVTGKLYTDYVLWLEAYVEFMVSQGASYHEWLDKQKAMKEAADAELAEAQANE